MAPLRLCASETCQSAAGLMLVVCVLARRDERTTASTIDSATAEQPLCSRTTPIGCRNGSLSIFRASNPAISKRLYTKWRCATSSTQPSGCRRVRFGLMSWKAAACLMAVSVTTASIEPCRPGSGHTGSASVHSDPCSCCPI
jgi:hypothetical protein